LDVVPSSTFFVAARPSKLLTAAFERYYALTFPHGQQDSGRTWPAQVTSLIVDVDDLSEDYPQVDTDEAYSLNISDAGGAARANARTVYGALRALESFSQLVRFEYASGRYELRGAPWRIEDKPRFPHRGLMIDTGRHYLPLASIRAAVDSMAYVKLNVLHWHIVDVQSFPFQSKSSAKLWDGAFSAYERYTQADVASVVEYARLRGVRVMVEFDMPGHADSWCVGYPEICPSLGCRTPLNVASEETFHRIDSLLQELTGGRASKPGAAAGLFPDSFVHLGGDEVNTSCWSATPSIAEWMRAQNLTADGAYARFCKRVAGMAIAQGRRPVQWSEVFDHFRGTLPKETIIHVWKNVTNVTEVVALGYDVIRNVGYDSKSWYLDNLDVQWGAVYQNDPCEGIPSGRLCSRVLGGHGEMWGETVDGSDLQQTVWPRLAAIAEKLWSSGEQTRDVAAAAPRIRALRCLLLERGVAAAPVDNGRARAAPRGPGACGFGSVASGGFGPAVLI